MSVQQITKALALRGVSQAEKLLLIVLANYADENGRCWPSQKRLGDDAAMSDRSVRTAFVKLEKAGLIVRERRNRRDGSRGTDMIELRLDAGEIQRKNLPVEKSSSGKKRTDYRKNLHELAEDFSRLTSFEPTIEPSIEPSLTRAREFGEEFALFWSEYPMQIDEHLAREAYGRARTKATFETILRGLAHAKAYSPRWRDGKMPDPVNWLKKERWNDKFGAVSAASQKRIAREENFRRAFNAVAEPTDRRGGDFGGG